MGAVAILFGANAALDDKQQSQVNNDIEQVQQLDDEDLKKFGVDTDALKDPEAAAEKRGSAYPTAELGLVDLSDMNNTERVEAAFKQIDDMVASVN